MGKSNIFLKYNTVIHNNVIIKDESILKKTKFKKDINIIILDQEVYIKRLKLNCLDDINEIIYNSFGEDKDYLFDYFTFKQELIIYAIKGGNRVLLIGNNAKNIKVTPIQIYLISRIKKIILDKIYCIIFNFKDNNYFISFAEGYIKLSIVEKNIKDLEFMIEEILDGEKIYIDNSIKQKILLNHIVNNIELGDILDEKRMFKQKFFT